jgi:hypothetical protein
MRGNEQAKQPSKTQIWGRRLVNWGGVQGETCDDSNNWGVRETMWSCFRVSGHLALLSRFDEKRWTTTCESPAECLSGA